MLRREESSGSLMKGARLLGAGAHGTGPLAGEYDNAREKDISAAGPAGETGTQRSNRPSHPVLELQRKYGNRYMQLALSAARQERSDKQATPENQPKVAGHRLLALQRRFGNQQVQRFIHSAGKEGIVSQSHSSPGKPLDKTARLFMEERFSRDFGQVRVHVSEDAPMLQAAAYTRGNDIFFAPEKYKPDSHEGRALIAHELVHVVQHNNGSSSGAEGLTSYSHPAEVEARSISRNVMEGGGPVRPQASLGAQAVARQLDPHSIYCALHAAVCLGLSENPPAAALCWANFAARCGGGQASADQGDSGQQVASADGSGTDLGGGAGGQSFEEGS